MKFHLFAAAALLSIGLSAVPATATVIAQQSTLVTNDRGAYQYFNQQLADDFVASTTAQLTSASWTGSYYGTPHAGNSESFTFNIFAGGTTPGALLYSVVGNASVSAANTASYYNYNLSFANALTLTAGTSYWADIYSNDSPANYAWADSTGTAAGAIRNGTGSWTQLNNNNRSNHVFALQGGAVDVPEPATVALVGLGLLGFAASRRKAAKGKHA